jgi:hypothetical protein
VIVALWPPCVAACSHHPLLLIVILRGHGAVFSFVVIVLSYRFCRCARFSQSRLLLRCACAALRLTVSFRQLVTAPLCRPGLEIGIEGAMRRAQKRKDLIMTTKTNSSRPTHRVYAVARNGDSKFWKSIGAMWAHADGSCRCR